MTPPNHICTWLLPRTVRPGVHRAAAARRLSCHSQAACAQRRMASSVRILLLDFASQAQRHRSCTSPPPRPPSHAAAATSHTTAPLPRVQRALAPSRTTSTCPATGLLPLVRCHAVATLSPVRLGSPHRTPPAPRRNAGEQANRDAIRPSLAPTRVPSPSTPSRPLGRVLPRSTTRATPTAPKQEPSSSTLPPRTPRRTPTTRELLQTQGPQIQARGCRIRPQWGWICSPDHQAERPLHRSHPAC